MKKLTYLAVFEKTENGGYSVYFPDLPGCIGCGNNYNAAYDDAKEALELHICGMQEDGEKLPTPTKDAIIDIETAKGYIVAPISIYPELVKYENDNKVIRTNVTIPHWLKYWAQSENINLSQTLQKTLNDMYLSSHNEDL